MQACERRGPDRMDYLNETPSRRRHDSRKRPLAVAVLTISIHNALGDSKMHGVCYMGLGGCSFERQHAEGGHFGGGGGWEGAGWGGAVWHRFLLDKGSWLTTHIAARPWRIRALRNMSGPRPFAVG